MEEVILDFKWSTTSVFASSFIVSLTLLGTILGIIDNLGFSPFKDNRLFGIIIVIQSCLIIAFLITYFKIQPNRYSDTPDYIKTFRKSGLENAFRIKKQNPQRETKVYKLVSEELNRGGHRCFRLVASSGYNYLDVRGNVWSHGLQKAIENGVEFKVVLESPFSEHAYARALASKIDVHHWADKVKIGHLEEISKKYKNLTIRVTSFPVNCSLFFTSENVFYDPYLWALPQKEERVDNHFWVLNFKNLGKNKEIPDGFECYNLLGLHFDFLFEHGVPLNDFLGNNRELYYKQTREFSSKLKHIKLKGY